ncbi:hypothetical protein EBU99_01120 [bacterium]|nr:hypothetical protein [bacterium]
MHLPCGCLRVARLGIRQKTFEKNEIQSSSFFLHRTSDMPQGERGLKVVIVLISRSDKTLTLFHVKRFFLKQIISRESLFHVERSPGLSSEF